MDALEPEEYLDVVDNNDVVVGRMLRTELHKQGLNNYRVINAFVVNSEGKLWVPRRTAHKTIYPLGLDISAAGHVSSGETYEQAFEREVMEELNLDVHTVPHRLLGVLSPYVHGVHAFEKIWEIKMDEVPNYNPDDFVEYFWLTPKELIARIDAGEYAKSDLPKLVKLFYADQL